MYLGGIPRGVYQGGYLPKVVYPGCVPGGIYLPICPPLCVPGGYTSLYAHHTTLGIPPYIHPVPST